MILLGWLAHRSFRDATSYPPTLPPPPPGWVPEREGARDRHGRLDHGLGRSHRSVRTEQVPPPSRPPPSRPRDRTWLLPPLRYSLHLTRKALAVRSRPRTAAPPSPFELAMGSSIPPVGRPSLLKRVPIRDQAPGFFSKAGDPLGGGGGFPPHPFFTPSFGYFLAPDLKKKAWQARRRALTPPPLDPPRHRASHLVLLAWYGIHRRADSSSSSMSQAAFVLGRYRFAVTDVADANALCLKDPGPRPPPPGVLGA